MRDHDRWIDVCLDTAAKAALAGDFPNGACVVVDHEVIAVSGSEAQGGVDPTAHAEVSVLRKAAASGRLSPGATLFTTLEPCAMCLHTAAAADVREIVFACRRNAVGDDAYLSKLDAAEMTQYLLRPLLLTHHGDPDGHVENLVATFLSGDRK